MDIDYHAIMTTAMGLGKVILQIIIGVGAVGGLAYYLFIVRRKRKWFCDVYEKKADGTLKLVGKDTLIEKRVANKQTAYIFKKSRHLALPPCWESVDRIGGKEYCDYLRVNNDYYPLKKKVSAFNDPEYQAGENQDDFFKKILKSINIIKKLDKKDVEQRYVYVPINYTLHSTVQFETMDYDIELMRIQAIELRDKVYRSTEDWWGKYGHFVALGSIIVLIIVVLYLSYDYSSQVVGQIMGQARETTGAIEILAEKLGGTPPPS